MSDIEQGKPAIAGTYIPSVKEKPRHLCDGVFHHIFNVRGATICPTPSGRIELYSPFLLSGLTRWRFGRYGLVGGKPRKGIIGLAPLPPAPTAGSEGPLGMTSEG